MAESCSNWNTLNFTPQCRSSSVTEERKFAILFAATMAQAATGQSVNGTIPIQDSGGRVCKTDED